MHAILINPYARTVTDIHVTGDSRGIHAALQEHDLMFSDMIERVAIGENVDLWIDEEGSCTEGRPVWRFDESEQHFAGTALILCNDTQGNSISCHIPSDFIGDKILWTSLEPTGDFEPSTEGFEEHPLFGKTWTIRGGKAIYREKPAD